MSIKELKNVIVEANRRDDFLQLSVTINEKGNLYLNLMYCFGICKAKKLCVAEIVTDTINIDTFVRTEIEKFIKELYAQVPMSIKKHIEERWEEVVC